MRLGKLGPSFHFSLGFPYLCRKIGFGLAIFWVQVRTIALTFHYLYQETFT